jgi:hypothetical protein
MLIYQCNDIRVMQHPFLQIFDVQQFMEGDDPRTYGRKHDYFTVKQCHSINEVRQLVHELQNKG